MVRGEEGVPVNPAPPRPHEVRIRLERIGDEVVPYFADDHGRTAHPDDGRMHPDE